MSIFDSALNDGADFAIKKLFHKKRKLALRSDEYEDEDGNIRKVKSVIIVKVNK